ncbi:helix-turn-helix transcriptional regulator [Catenuloplanes japonicus]|uniref:helix-turn-helix transcriptional regulator n=1 Tax=Catenuloplanes japonicus TaxID=33876 RepID=UPI0005240706|nr:helix-turn-helix transcriptional regulator [Catenuloplanes japonicus]
MPTIFESTDLDAASDMMRRTYGTVRIAAAGDRHGVRIDRDVVGATELHLIAFAMRFDASAPPLRTLVVGRVAAGTVTYRDRRRCDHYGTGDVYLMGQPREGYDTRVDRAGVEFARISPALINLIAESESATPVRFTGYRPIDAAAARLWARTYAFARENAVTAATEPLLADSVSQLLAATALSIFPSTVLRDPTIEDRHDAHPAMLRRAIAFIESYADREIGLADIAAEARVTIRAVQLGFQRHLATTPLAYLRRIRLAQAHRELALAAPGATTVAAVAARWGFLSHSRFTARYRDTYGCTPSQTLHRR